MILYLNSSKGPLEQLLIVFQLLINYIIRIEDVILKIECQITKINVESRIQLTNYMPFDQITVIFRLKEKKSEVIHTYYYIYICIYIHT